jgi:hypothetical protein
MKRHGYGKLMLHNGNFYEGEFEGKPTILYGDSIGGSVSIL